VGDDLSFSTLDGFGFDALRSRPTWPAAVRRLKLLWDRAGDNAKSRAEEYGEVYAGRRGAMVVDVVASRQRRYNERVLPDVARWEAGVEEPTLKQLAGDQPGLSLLRLPSKELETIVSVAQGFLRFADERGLGEDDACQAWATEVESFEHAPTLDSYVGDVKGIGVALFAYMRMRCGTDALKPDLRVRNALNRLGFDVPNDPHAILITGQGAAIEIGVSPLVLDQLLWWATDFAEVI
jgi:hypothetical protein